MTDFFALLNQPRRPWLDEAALKESYHGKTRELHPDARRQDRREANSFPYSFAELNEAYRALSSPASRLQHLLGLNGESEAARTHSIPPRVEELFPAINAAISNAKLIAQKLDQRNTALGRGLLAMDLARARSELERCEKTLSQLNDASLADLRALDSEWDAASRLRREHARELQTTFTYLSRWRSQIGELRLQLGS